MGLIRPSVSPMASPIVCVAKKSGVVRIACDYRYLNSFTVGDVYPMSTINETLSKIGSSQIISTFDVKSGYWQIPVAEEVLTTFIAHDGLYEWVRMPFGLKNAGATFVRAVRSVLTPICDFYESYVDDIGVGSDGWSQHLNHIRLFLGIIKEVGMTLNIETCEFAKPDVKLVGHFVGSEGHRPDPTAWRALTKYHALRPKRSSGSFSVLLATTEIISSILLTSLNLFRTSPVRRFLTNYRGRNVISKPTKCCVVSCVLLMCCTFRGLESRSF